MDSFLVEDGMSQTGLVRRSYTHSPSYLHNNQARRPFKNKLSYRIAPHSHHPPHPSVTHNYPKRRKKMRQINRKRQVNTNAVFPSTTSFPCPCSARSLSFQPIHANAKCETPFLVIFSFPRFAFVASSPLPFHA